MENKKEFREESLQKEKEFNITKIHLEKDNHNNGMGMEYFLKAMPSAKSMMFSIIKISVFLSFFIGIITLFFLFGSKLVTTYIQQHFLSLFIIYSFIVIVFYVLLFKNRINDLLERFRDKITIGDFGKDTNIEFFVMIIFTALPILFCYLLGIVS